MSPIDGQPILPAATMRVAEARAIDEGSSDVALMEHAGAGIAEAVRRLAANAPVLVLCGPGNNGGDGYVAARGLRDWGVDVRVAAAGDPKTDAAIAAATIWKGKTEALADAAPAPILIDALFGTGLSRALDDATAAALAGLTNAARLSIAVDLPSGVHTDTGALLGASRALDVTLALGALKPAHVLEPSASLCGVVRLLPLPIRVSDQTARVAPRRPALPAPDAGATKYNRGMVAIVAGAMPGASALSAEAALRAGAGYALLVSDHAPPGLPHAVVTRPWSAETLADRRIGALLIGPGLGRDDIARERLNHALATDHALVLDGDALHLLDGRTFADRMRPTFLTPHAGEFAAMFGAPVGSKIDAARDAARASGAHVVFKGPDTVIANPDGRVTVVPRGPGWLSTAGTGDVLAGALAAMVAARIEPHDAAVAAVWLHAEAARRLGAAFLADDLARALSQVRTTA